MKKQHFIYAIVVYIIALFYLATITPLTPHEANIYYTQHSVVSLLMHWGENMIEGFLGLRLFFLFFGFVSIGLFYQLSQRYFPHQKDSYTATAIFMILPGIITASTLANVAIIVLLLVLLFVLLYENKIRYPLPLLMLALFFVHEASIIFFVALFLYGIVYKDQKLVIGASAFLIAFIYLAKGIEIGGRPSGHFLEIFGLYATVFSPLLFLYFFYAMYRILLREKKELLWFISFTALAFSLLLSLRQKVYITDFAPYVMISIIPMLALLNRSIRVRLPQFQVYYRRGFNVVILLLVLNSMIILFHEALYRFSGSSSKHFASRIYKPYDLAQQLHAQNIHCYDNAQKREIYQLKYYQISRCPN